MNTIPLTLVLALVSIVSTLALFVNWAANRHIQGLKAIAVGFAIASVGNLLFSNQFLDNPLITVLAAYALILGGRIPIVLGLAAFWNQSKSMLPLLCVALYILTMGSIYYFTLIDDDSLWRGRVYTLMMLIFSACSIYLIGYGLFVEKKARPVLTISPTFGAFLALVLLSFNAVTESILMVVQTQVVSSGGSQDGSFIILGLIFTGVVFAFAIIIMTMEELTIEHKENSIYDPITTILNHRTFIEVGQRIMGVALRYSKPVSLLSIEVENMEEVVKEHGYKVGNEMLRHFSLVATDRRRSEDLLARSSFKQFHMLLPGVDELGAKVVMDKIKRAVETEDFVYHGESIKVEFSIASITRREEDLEMTDMLQQGEVELFRVRGDKGLLDD